MHKTNRPQADDLLLQLKRPESLRRFVRLAVCAWTKPRLPILLGSLRLHLVSPTLIDAITSEVSIFINKAEKAKSELTVFSILREIELLCEEMFLPTEPPDGGTNRRKQNIKKHLKGSLEAQGIYAQISKEEVKNLHCDKTTIRFYSLPENHMAGSSLISKSGHVYDTDGSLSYWLKYKSHISAPNVVPDNPVNGGRGCTIIPVGGGTLPLRAGYPAAGRA